MMHAPAPVEARKAIVAPAEKKRTGLIPMAPGSDHRMPFGDREITVRARSSDDVVGFKRHFVCLHERCRGKQWTTLAEMYGAHPSGADMAKREESHVFGQWSDDVLDATKIDALKKAADRAQMVLDAKVKKSPTDPEEFAAYDAAIVSLTAKRDEAALALARAQAPVGLIAPPDLRPEAM